MNSQKLLISRRWRSEQLVPFGQTRRQDPFPQQGILLHGKPVRRWQRKDKLVGIKESHGVCRTRSGGFQPPRIF